MPLSRFYPRWQRLVFLLFFIVLIVFNVWILRVATTNRSTNELLDCARRLSTSQQDKRDHASIAAHETEYYFYTALLNQADQGPQTPEQRAAAIAEFTKLVNKAKVADEVVQKLPDLASLVAKECPG